MRWLLSSALLLFSMAVHAAGQVLYMAGDSTMANKLLMKRPETGWGEMLQQHFDPALLRVENHARNGRSTRTFLSQGLWQVILDRLQPGDWVFLQFGHNDESVQKPDRYTPPADYQHNLAGMIDDVRAKSAVPVLLTPVERRQFSESGEFTDSHGVYPELVRQLAESKQVAVLDAQQLTRQLLVENGAEGSKALFLHLPPGSAANYRQGLQDNTHFSPLGARTVAALVVAEIRRQHLAPLSEWLHPVTAASP